MKKITFLTMLMISGFAFSQFSTGTVTLSGTTNTIKIDTDATTVTLTYKGPSTAWFGVGFGGLAMGSVTDYFIWNSTTNRDYAPGSAAHSTPVADAASSQSWTVTDVVAGSFRTITATRPLVSAGDYTFLNSNTSIPIIFAQGSSTVFGYHDTNPHSGQTLQRSQLGVEDFSLNATSVYPNPTSGTFKVQTRTSLDQINIYSLTGQFVRTIDVTDKSEKVEVDIKDLTSGTYLIELKNANEKSWKKIIVE